MRALNRRPVDKTREGKETPPVIKVGFRWALSGYLHYCQFDQFSDFPLLLNEKKIGLF